MKEVVVGNWFPRTRLHLKEFYDFIKGDDLGFEKGESSKKRKSCNLSNIKYVNANIDYVEAIFEENKIIYTQDGVIYVIGKEKKKINKFFEKNLIPLLSFIYSKGAPVPKLVSGMERNYFENVKNFKIIEFEIMLNDYESFMQKALDTHRTLWDEVNDIRSKERVFFKDLPKLRDTLMDVKKDISFIASRIKQMKTFISFRKSYSSKETMSQLKKRKILDFNALMDMGDYIQELIAMTENYVDTTLEMVQMIYQENEQKELNTLQIIFAIGVVASFLALGAMPGANLVLNNAEGELFLQGQIASFEFLSLVKFGLISLVFAFLVFWVLHFLFKGAKSFKLVNLLKGKKKEIDF